MVDESPSTPTLQPYDLVRLRAGNPLGVDPGTLLVVADTVDNQPGIFEVHHQDDHPAYMDWAGAVTADDVAVAIQVSGTTAHSWSPRP